MTINNSISNLSNQQIIFLAELPRFLNSTLVTADIIDILLRKLCLELKCEAATTFLLSSSGMELRFWASHGGKSSELSGKKMPADQGIVGWVIKNRKSVHVRDVNKDERFFKTIDNETDFKTKEILCSPLIAQGEKIIGAVQVLNSLNESGFNETDQLFIERVCDQASLAIFNAQLYHNARKSAQTLAELQRRRDDLISVISHEFRTPLNIIQNSIELLGMSDINEDMRNQIESTAARSITKLTELISRMRDVSESAPGSTFIKKEKISLSELFKTLESEFSIVCSDKRSLNLSFDIREGAEHAKGDSTLIAVAIINLISNAIRFTPDGGKISVTASSSSGLVKISVSDSGIGICESNHQLIFEKFYEVTDVANHSSGKFEFRSSGLGLGLPTVKNICEAHGTELELQSSIDSGSCFSFCLQK
ncbi:MAG TPA: GAF domain-containing sensor histidine kinase [Oligoflexia bacterium]|nr:GAF domain-containing sensor histidine kinase [Oligoflexia bacterium]HMP47688.1 GAF domain-containing sensor histidine kinase [Oligoflexia bacterium]